MAATLSAPSSMSIGVGSRRGSVASSGTVAGGDDETSAFACLSRAKEGILIRGQDEVHERACWP